VYFYIIKQLRAENDEKVSPLERREKEKRRRVDKVEKAVSWK